MIAVVGGTGRLGRLVAERLVAAGEPVRVIARSEPADPVPSARFVAADVRDLGALAPAIAGADVVVSAVHGMDPSSGSPRGPSTVMATSTSSGPREASGRTSSSSRSSAPRQTTGWSCTG